jgi:hypothetical protein
LPEDKRTFNAHLDIVSILVIKILFTTFQAKEYVVLIWDKLSLDTLVRNQLGKVRQDKCSYD